MANEGSSKDKQPYHKRGSVLSGKAIENRKARFNYEIKEEYEAGVVLTGPEVKSVKSGHISLKEAFATVRGGEIWLTNAHVTPYSPANQKDYEPTRSRKLLLKKEEINSLIGAVGEQGMTLVPLKVFVTRGKVKVLIGLGRGKRKYDKRETIKKRELERDTRREMKG